MAESAILPLHVVAAHLSLPCNGGCRHRYPASSRLGGCNKNNCLKTTLGEGTSQLLFPNPLQLILAHLHASSQCVTLPKIHARCWLVHCHQHRLKRTSHRNSSFDTERQRWLCWQPVGFNCSSPSTSTVHNMSPSGTTNWVNQDLLLEVDGK